MRKPFCASIVAFVVFLAGPPTAGWAAELSPEDTVKQYLQAIQGQQFEKAYELVSSNMKKDRRSGEIKSKEVWVKESQYVMQFSEAKILDFKIYPAKTEGDKAKVPNVLSSQDKFLNQLGVEEYEIYTLVKENGAWKVDQQEEVVESAEIAKWFPKSPPAAKQ
jgi:hypothetical protein